jgi:hypothetical protein
MIIIVVVLMVRYNLPLFRTAVHPLLDNQPFCQSSWRLKCDQYAEKYAQREFEEIPAIDVSAQMKIRSR